MNINDLLNDSKCNGCHACESSCPYNCIDMNDKGEGFLYPIVDRNICVDCEICIKVCPVINPPQPENIPVAYASYNKNNAIRNLSSSGGIFDLISKNILNKGGVVFGAAMSDDCSFVEHICIDSLDKLSVLYGSKYLQSKIGNTYRQVKEYLKEDKYVLFTGTPCQVGALKSYLKKDYEKLYTQDLVCHGVASPLAWKKYLSSIEKRFSSKVSKVFFRNKTYGWKLFSMKIQFSNGTEYLKDLTKDSYFKGFISNLYLRQSCHDCSFKTISRISDITLADFWGIDNVSPEMNDDKGTSLVIIHSDKGKELFSELKNEMNFEKVDLMESLKSNISVCKSVAQNPLRKLFFKGLQKKDFEKLIQKYCGNAFLPKLRRFIAKKIQYIRYK